MRVAKLGRSKDPQLVGKARSRPRRMTRACKSCTGTMADLDDAQPDDAWRIRRSLVQKEKARTSKA